MYIELHRTAPYPLLASFDAPAGYGPTCRRIRSTTALQALNLLNDPVFVEAAQSLAYNIGLIEGSFADRLEYAFRVCLGRPPDSREREHLLSYFEKQERLVEANAGSAAKLSPADQSPEGAAWVGLSSVLLNLDEFITRE